MRTSIDKKILGGLALALGAVLTVAFISYRSAVDLVEAGRWVLRTSETLTQLESTLSSLREAEDASRGYVITGDTSFLGASTIALTEYQAHLNSLRTLVPDDRLQQQRVDSLRDQASSLIDYFDRTVTARASEGFDAATRLIVIHSAANQMRLIRGLIDEMKGKEKTLLVERALEREEGVRKTLFTLSLFVALVVCGFVAVYMIIRKDLSGRRKAEEEIRSTSDLLDSIVENIPAMIFMKDAADLRFVRFNKAGETLTGYSRKDLLGKNDYDFFPKQEADFFTSKDREVLTEQKLVDIPEEPIQTRHQGTRILHTRKISLFGKDGRPKYLLGISVDITEDKLAERAFRESQERFAKTFASSPVGISIARLSDRRIIDANESYLKLTGYSRDEIIGHTPAELGILSPESSSRISSALTTAKSVRNLEMSFIEKSGRVLTTLTSFETMDLNGELCVLMIVLDITERRLAEEELERSQERLRLMVSSIKDYAILMLDPEGRIATWNDGAERIKGFTEREIIGQNFSRFYPEKDRLAKRPALALKTAAELGSFHDENWRIRKDGSRFWASVVITPLRDGTGRLQGFVKVTKDMSEQKEGQEAVRKLNLALRRQSTQLEAANRELESFSYSVSHDLRAPLRSIDGFSQALLEDYSDRIDAKGKEFLNKVRAATQRMAQLIDDLLNLSRTSRAEMRREETNLSEIASAIAQELRKADPARDVSFDIAPGISCHADSRLLRVVLENLLGNAWKYTKNHSRARIQFGSSETNGERVYFVRDDGAGFEMEHAGKLFGAFQRLHLASEFPGSGIGLATVQRIIHRHGGRTWAEGEVEKGATFYFTL